MTEQAHRQVAPGVAGEHGRTQAVTRKRRAVVAQGCLFLGAAIEKIENNARQPRLGQARERIDVDGVVYGAGCGADGGRMFHGLRSLNQRV